jgi:hypothetical protein
MVMHDVVEHLTPADGTVEAELKAIGAHRLVRENSGVLAALGVSWVELTATNLALTATDVFDPAFPLAAWPLAAPSSGGRPLGREVEQELSEAFDLAALTLADWIGGAPPGMIGETRSRCLAWIRCGYRAARLAFAAHSPQAIGDLALRMAYDAEALLAEHAGDEVALTARFDPATLDYGLSLRAAREGGPRSAS